MTVVLFDGFCSSCNRWAQWIEKRDHKSKFKLIAQDSEEGDDAMAGCPMDIREHDSVIINSGTRWYSRSTAVCQILWGLSPFWKIIGSILWLIPRPIRNLVYDFYAARRHRLPTADS